MKKILLTLLFVCFASSAQALEACPTHETVRSRVADEFCEYLSHHAEQCFSELNRQLIDAQETKKSRPLSSSETSELLANYTASIAKVKNYLPELKREVCLDQAGEVEVLVEELEKDLAEARQLK